MKLLKISSIVALSLPLLTACLDDSKNNESVEATTQETATPETAKTQNSTESVEDKSNLPTHRVAVIDRAFEPYTFPDENGSASGMTIDIINGIADAEGFNVEFVPRGWDPTFEYLDSEKISFVGIPVVVTEERDKIVDYSDPITAQRTDMLVSDKLKDKSFDEILADDSLIYSTVNKTIWHAHAIKYGIAEDNIRTHKLLFSTVRDVLVGDADVALAYGDSLKYFKKQYPELSFVKNPTEPLEISLMVKEGDAEMQSTLNSGLKKLKASGEYDKIHEKWLGE